MELNPYYSPSGKKDKKLLHNLFDENKELQNPHQRIELNYFVFITSLNRIKILQPQEWR